MYATQLPDVSGFQLSARWYGIALGPYARPDAEQQLAILRARGAIPGDSFLAEADRFLRQFWPIGANDLAGSARSIPLALAPAPTLAPLPELQATDETPRQARASENLLSLEEKQLIQTALASQGFYDATIDGLFGRGTRASMASWQTANAYEATGVLTSAQRAALVKSYNSILDGLGLEVVSEIETGISIKLPTEQIAFKEYEFPFAHYDASTDQGIQVSLISQEGGRDRFRGLYSVLQTLDVVPTNGARQIGPNRFTITGVDATRHTTVDVRLADGAMKGFLLVWPANDEERQTRVLSEMQSSFRTVPGTLDPSLSPPDESQSIDLLAGLDIRQPQTAATGFFVDRSGSVLTASETLGACERVSIGDDVDADVVFTDADLGLALLRPRQSVAPLGIARFQTAVPRLRDEVAVAGFSYGGDLGAPTLTLGALADLRGLEGDQTVKRLELRAEPGDSGGPVLDGAGAVLGLLRPAPQIDGQILPENVRFAVDTETIRDRLAAEGVTITETDAAASIDPVELAALATDMSVLVQCW
ncbi:MAG: serine protease [Pseudomonadota bacterium]